MLKKVACGLTLLLFGVGILSAQEPADQAQRPKPTVQKPAGQQNAPPQEPARPMVSRGKLFVQQPSWDFGHVSQDAQVTHRFILENVGDDSLFIEKIKPT
jgi:hypothetical protein